MIFLLENKNRKITGAVHVSTSKELSKVTDAELKENELLLSFNTEGVR